MNFDFYSPINNIHFFQEIFKPLACARLGTGNATSKKTQVVRVPALLGAPRITGRLEWRSTTNCNSVDPISQKNSCSILSLP